MGHGKYCFLLFPFVIILFLSECRKQFRDIMIGSTCSVFNCLTCDLPFFFTAVYRLLNVEWALVDQNMWLRLFIEFKSLPGAAGFQLSNPPLWQAVSLLGSLNVSTSNGLILPIQRAKKVVSYSLGPEDLAIRPMSSRVSSIKILHVLFTSVPILLESENTSYTYKLHWACESFIKLTPLSLTCRDACGVYTMPVKFVIQKFRRFWWSHQAGKMYSRTGYKFMIDFFRFNCWKARCLNFCMVDVKERGFRVKCARP